MPIFPQADHSSDAPLDAFQVADLLTSRALASHRDEIDLIAYYGSYAQGTAKPTSDLDIFYVPAEGKDPPVARTFLLQGRLFDFWGIPWDILDGFATGRLRGWSFAPAIVHHAKVLHARSNEQSARLEVLKQKVLDLQSPDSRPLMIQRALDEFMSVLANLGNLHLAMVEGDFSDLRHAGWKLILAVWECLALANQVFCDRGWSDMPAQISRLSSRPDDLEELIIIISTSPDTTAIVSAAEKLAAGTRKVLLELQQTLTGQRTPGEVFDGAYPEIKDGLRKVFTACERGQPVMASVAAWFAQYDFSLMLNSLQSNSNPATFNLYHEFASQYRRLDFPDLLPATSGNLADLADRTRLLDERLRQWFIEQPVRLCEYGSLEEFERL